jgi:hypothetical protein
MLITIFVFHECYNFALKFQPFWTNNIARRVLRQSILQPMVLLVAYVLRLLATIYGCLPRGRRLLGVRQKQ